MIKARIRWCTCRVENILTLGKLLRLWFCFLLHSILFFIYQSSYHTYKIISSYELARPIMGTILSSYPRAQAGDVIGLVSVYIYIRTCSCHKKKIVIERTRDLIYLKFVATDFFPKIISPLVKTPVT